MAVEYTIQPATIIDAREMAPQMREVDVQELFDGWGSNPTEALVGSVERSLRAYTARADGEIVCMYGVGTEGLLAPAGKIWMLGTDLINKHKRQFLLKSAGQIGRLSRGYYFLENHCDKRNTLTVRWLRWLGFTIEDPKPYGINGKLFHHFWKVV